MASKENNSNSSINACASFSQRGHHYTAAETSLSPLADDSQCWLAAVSALTSHAVRHPYHRPVPNASSSELPQKFVAPERDGLPEQNENSRHDRTLSLSPTPRLCSPFFKARAFVHCTNSTGYVSESGPPPFSRVDPCSCSFPISNLITLAEVDIFTKQALFRHLTCIWQFSRVQLPPHPT